MLVDRKNITLFVDARYEEKAKNECFVRIKIMPVQELHSIRLKLKSCAIESKHVSVDLFLQWKRKFKNTKFVQTTNIIEEFRREKRPEELRSIKRACAITKKVLRQIPSLLKQGITERALAQTIEQRFYDEGADGIAFPSIVAFGEHTSRPHHEPTARKFKNGDLVQIDCGCSLHGYASDFSRVIPSGVMNEKQKKCHRALTKAKKAAEKKLRPGITNHELDRTARDILQKEGLAEYFTHSLGHGLGLNIHEGAMISLRAPLQKLKKNEVVTIEPGVYFPGEWGMRLEDTHIL